MRNGGFHAVVSCKRGFCCLDGSERLGCVEGDDLRGCWVKGEGNELGWRLTQCQERGGLVCGGQDCLEWLARWPNLGSCFRVWSTESVVVLELAVRSKGREVVDNRRG